MEELYYNEKNKEYILANTDRVCDKCKNLLLEVNYSCVFIREVGRTFDDLKIYCMKCGFKMEVNPFAKYVQKNFARICRNIPEDSLLIIPINPTIQNMGKMHETFLQDSKFNAFDVENINKEYKGKTIDRTKLAGRESWGDAQIGANISPELEKLDNPLRLDEGLNLLDNLKDSELILPEYTEEKLLKEGKD